MKRRKYIPLPDQLEAALRNTKCGWCGELIGGRKGAALDHVDMLEISADNSPDNLQWLHADPCHKEKTMQDASRWAKTRRQMNKHEGVVTRRKKEIQSRGFQTNRNGEFKKPLSGPTERRS